MTIEAKVDLLIVAVFLLFVFQIAGFHFFGLWIQATANAVSELFRQNREGGDE